ncbi:MAG: sodium:proton antiporter [Peptococcaceae bacterium]|nr:sodium:proton antiporter [Peptococcaceae bacterium]
MHGTIWSLLPFIVVIPLALFTRQVLPGLVMGLLIGSYMLTPSLLGGVDTALQYVLKELAIPDNLRLIVFMYGFGAFVGLVRITGGVSGFAQWMEARVTSGGRAFMITWLSALLTFMAPDFRIITVGPVMKQVFTRLKVATSKVAFVIDATATPLCAIMPLGTVFIGYIIGLISTVSRHQGITTPAYTMFLHSIPFNFFSLAMLAFALVYSFRKSDAPSEKTASTGQIMSVAQLRSLGSAQLAYNETAGEIALPLPKQRGTGKKIDEHERADSFPDSVDLVARKVTPHALNLIVPLAVLLSFTLFYTWLDGHMRAPGLLNAFIQANAAKAMLEALLTTLLLAFGWYTVQKQPLARTIYGFLQGGNEMMAVNVLLVLVWAVSAISTDLGFVAYTAHTAGSLIPPAIIAPAFFVFGCLLSYVIGSSFGTWGILLPLGFSLAGTEHASLPLIAGAVFASGTFGGFVSPLSDNTVAMATVMKIPLMEYAKLKLRYGLMVAGVCTIMYGIAGWLYR